MRLAVTLCLIVFCAAVFTSLADENEAAKKLDQVAKRVRDKFKNDPASITEFLRACRETNHFALGTLIGDLMVKGDEARVMKEALPRTALPWPFWDEYSVCQYYVDRFDGALDAAEIVLQDPTFDHTSGVAQRIVANRFFSLNRAQDRFATYNETRVQILKQHLSTQGSREKHDYCVSIASGHGLEFLQKTVNSLIQACSDCDKATLWTIVDDGSSQADRAAMQSQYPFFQFIFDSPSGLENTLHTLRTRVWNKCTYVLHMTDTFKFISRKPYLRWATRVFVAEPTVGQVMLSGNYGCQPTDHEIFGPSRRAAPDDDTREGASKVGYSVHEYYPPGSQALTDYLAANNNPTKHAAIWPHFSLHPSVIKTAALEKLPAIPLDLQARAASGLPAEYIRDGKTNVELWLAIEYTKAGLKTAFLSHVNVLVDDRLKSFDRICTSTCAYEARVKTGHEEL